MTEYLTTDQKKNLRHSAKALHDGPLNDVALNDAWLAVIVRLCDEHDALVEEAKALGELQDACIKRYCGMTGPDEWREAVRKSPEGQRLTALAATQSEHGECIWTYNDEPNDYWQTECGNAFQLVDGKPSGNYMTYCPYCGRKIAEAAAQSEQGEGDD